MWVIDQREAPDRALLAIHISLVEQQLLLGNEASAEESSGSYVGQLTLAVKRRACIQSKNRVWGMSSCGKPWWTMVPAEQIGTRGGDPVILVVEDEILVRMSVSEHLRNAGFSVIEAGDADEALRLLRVRPDVVLMLTDIRLPGTMDGSALIRVLRSERPQLKVIAGSGVGTPEPVAASIKKPYDYQALMSLIESALNR